MPAEQVITNRVELLTYEVDAALDRGSARCRGLSHDRGRRRPAGVNGRARTKMPLVARGAGTGLSGGAVAEHGGVIV